MPGVGEIEERFPPVGAALPPGRAGVGFEDAAQLAGIGDCGRHVSVARDDPAIEVKQPPRLGPPFGLVIGVGQAGEAEELRGRAAVRRHPLGESAVAGDEGDVGHCDSFRT
jgi:hypothetical protein